ncbi:10280_t:CDS:2 [Gigaspora margarita]|uniref:10280_t:CDS:1 n=1 Tax=Gigaspora margarita TaxID=4874 RepID=A0ABN7VHG8_GIGMA|nr:10280_t:CDS:2 [Gigaspora margarita]
MNISTSASDIFNQISNLCYICQEPIKKPVTVLQCDHILYFNCAIRFFAISKNIICLVRNCQDQIKNIEAVEENINNLVKALKPGNTPKRFLLLYKNIDQAEKLLARLEKNVIHAKKEVILSYYQLRKAGAEKLKELLKKPTPLCSAQNKIVADIKKLLPNNTSINVIKKRIATARKIYDIFSTIGEDKIQRIRNFSVSSIGAFKKDEIEFIKTGDNKSKFRIERKSLNI